MRRRRVGGGLGGLFDAINARSDGATAAGSPPRSRRGRRARIRQRDPLVAHGVRARRVRVPRTVSKPSSVIQQLETALAHAHAVHGDVVLPLAGHAGGSLGPLRKGSRRKSAAAATSASSAARRRRRVDAAREQGRRPRARSQSSTGSICRGRRASCGGRSAPRRAVHRSRPADSWRTRVGTAGQSAGAAQQVGVDRKGAREAGGHAGERAKQAPCRRAARARARPLATPPAFQPTSAAPLEARLDHVERPRAPRRARAAVVPRVEPMVRREDDERVVALRQR